jgi:hypothetical protein
VAVDELCYAAVCLQLLAVNHWSRQVAEADADALYFAGELIACARRLNGLDVALIVDNCCLCHNLYYFIVSECKVNVIFSLTQEKVQK